MVYHSYHHGNTDRVAARMAEVLGADRFKAEEVEVVRLLEYDLIGFGSGIFFSRHHKSLLRLADAFPSMNDKKAFIFSTAGRGDPWMERNHRALKKKLEGKGFKIVGEYTCNAFDTFFFLRLIGGINKGRPNEEDLKKAEDFARNLVSGNDNLG